MLRKCVSVLLLVCFAKFAQAQVSQGWILGTVQESPGDAPLQAVQVTAVGRQSAPLTTATGRSGWYCFPAIPPGVYDLQFRRAGYPDHFIRGIVVEGSRTSTADLMMARSGASTEIRWRGKPASPWGTDYGGTFSVERLSTLPSAHNIWAVIENQEPSAITNAPQEGGFTTGVIALAGVLGSSWTQNGYHLDGINVADPFEPGKPLVYPDYSGLQEVQVSAALHSAQIAGPGASFNMASRASARGFHFGAEGYFQGKPVQSNNLDQRLRGLGWSETPHFERFEEGEAKLGGGVPRLHDWSFYSDFGIQHLTRSIPGFSVTPRTTVRSVLLRFDGMLGPHDQLALMSTDQVINQSNLGAQPGVTPAATLRGYDRFEVVQGHWTRRRLTDVWQVRGGFSHSSPTDTFQRGITEASRIQLFTGEIAGAAPLESDSARTRFSLVAQGEAFRSFWRGRHLLEFGIDLEESKATEERRVAGGFQQIYFPRDVPCEVIEYNSPSHSKQRLRELSFFLDDRLRIGHRVFLRAGLLLDSSNVFLPPQESQTGVFVPVRKFKGADSVVSWTTLSPRIGLSVPFLSRFGGTRFSAGYARYYHVLPASYANFANPTAIAGQVFTWNDRNDDRLFQQGEEGTLIRVFGGGHSSVDPNLHRPFTDELALGLDQNFGNRLLIEARGFRKVQKRLVQAVNVGVPASRYSPVPFFDPGDDDIPGTSDDRVLTVFNRDPRSFGQDRYVLTNPAGLQSSYNGLEVTIRGDLAGRGFVSLSFSAYKSAGTTNPGNTEFENDPGVVGRLFDDPNRILNARGRVFWDRAYTSKIASYTRLPWGFYAASVIRYADGLPFGRRLIVTGLNQGPFCVMATPRGQPGGFRTQFDLSFDQRLARDFTAGRFKFSAMVDIFNLLNRRSNLREYDITGPLFPSRTPLEIQNPRVLRLGLVIGVGPGQLF